MNKKRYILLALILLTMSLGMTAKNKTVQKRLYGVFHRYSGVGECKRDRENRFPVWSRLLLKSVARIPC